MLNIKINGRDYTVPYGTTVLEACKQAGIEIPTLCYLKEMNEIGACRMCMVENEWGGLDAACSTPPKAGASVKTNTERLRRYRKNILELLLANHCRDCTVCENNNKCKLQDLAMRFNIEGVRFPNRAKSTKNDDTSSVCIVRDAGKCILCGDCVRVCNEIQTVGAIDFAHRGSNMTISTAFNMPLAESPCVGCGQCAAVCPMRLQPLYMYRFTNAGRVDELNRMNLMDCMECGSCAFTCPGKLPLVETFRKGKQMVREAQKK